MVEASVCVKTVVGVSKVMVMVEASVCVKTVVGVSKVILPVNYLSSFN